jgi:hypothetical protein
MLRKLLAGAVVVAGVLALAVPAQAKGEGGKITIKESRGGGGGVPFGTGGGSRGGGGGSGVVPLLSSPLVITGEKSAFWFEATGFGQYKNEAPTVYGGTVPPSKLGPAFAVTASFLCGQGHRGTIHQTLYPYAKGGPQTFTPANQFMCGMELGEGWWMGSSSMFDELVDTGLPAHGPPPVTVVAGASSSVAHDDRATWPLILAGGLALTLLLVSGALVQRRGRKVRVPA